MINVRGIRRQPDRQDLSVPKTQYSLACSMPIPHKSQEKSPLRHKKLIGIQNMHGLKALMDMYTHAEYCAYSSQELNKVHVKVSFLDEWIDI